VLTRPPAVPRDLVWERLSVPSPHQTLSQPTQLVLEHQAELKQKQDYQKLYREENKDTLRQKQKLYRQENKDTIRQRQKLYREENKDTLRQKLKLYRQENKDALRQKLKLYRQDNKDTFSQKQKLYRQENKDTISQKQKVYWEENKDTLSQKKKQFYQDNKDTISQKQKLYRQENKDTISQKQKLYRQENKDTLSQKQKQFYQENKDSIRQKQKMYRQENKDTLSQKQKLYHQENKDSIRQRKKLYREENKDTIRQKQKLYRQENKDTLSQKNRLYRQLKTQYNVQPEPRDWLDDPNKVRSVLEDLATKLNLKTSETWYRVSKQLLKDEPKGRQLINKFGHIIGALKFGLPEINWDEKKAQSRQKRSTQWWLKEKISEIIQGTEIIEEYQHPDLFWNSGGRSVEFDIWIPKYNIAIEYHGEQHYFDIHAAFGPSDLYSDRDIRKKQLCEEHGITYFVVPYWWDRKIESVAASLYQACPNVFPKTGAQPIPDDPPRQGAQASKIHAQMHGVEWSSNGRVDPTGWYMSEKLDGYRAYWDGTDLWTRGGHLINVPLDFKACLPKVELDGELWCGYETSSQVGSILKRCLSSKTKTTEEELSSLWSQIKFCIFDLPNEPGTYPERHAKLKDLLPENQNISIVPMTRCEGIESLNTMLNEIRSKSGEGVMLYHPTAPYMPGRTNYLQKVKVYEEVYVKFVQKNPNSYSLICDQADGVQIKVKCCGYDYESPPEVGTVIQIRHSGIVKNSKKFKYPILTDIRTDLKWDTLVQSKPKQPPTPPTRKGAIDLPSGLTPEQHRTVIHQNMPGVTVVNDVDSASAVLKILYQFQDFPHAVDIEVIDLNLDTQGPVGNGKVICCSIYVGPDVNFGNGPRLFIDNLDYPSLQFFKSYFEDQTIKKVCHNYSFDRHELFNHGIDIAGFAGDTMHMARLWDPDRHSYSLEYLVQLVDQTKSPIEKRFGIGKNNKVPPLDDIQRSGDTILEWIDHVTSEAHGTWDLFKFLHQKLIETESEPSKSMWDLYEQYWLPFGLLLTDMEQQGTMVDLKLLKKLVTQAKNEKKSTRTKFLEMG